MAKKDPNEPDNKARKRLDEFNRQRQAVPEKNDDDDLTEEENVEESEREEEEDDKNEISKKSPKK